MIKLGGGWDEALAPLFADEKYKAIREFLKKEYTYHTVYPDMYDIYNCFRYTPLANVKVVLLGQDPYHNVGQAHGLCFSVRGGHRTAPFARQYLQGTARRPRLPYSKDGRSHKVGETGRAPFKHGADRARTHGELAQNRYTYRFTDSVISLLSEKKEHLVFLLWGGNARSKKPLIDGSKHLILECAHPSPLSAYNGFFGCRHFSKTNAYLEKNGIAPIDWDLTRP